MASVEEVSDLLSSWEELDGYEGDVVPILTRLCEVFELETEAFLKKNPDPFDDRHPSRTIPDCALGYMLKSVLRNQRLVEAMGKDYWQRNAPDLNTVVCRLLLNLLPGLEVTIFQEEGFVRKLFLWAEVAPNPLQSYATGLLGAAMVVPEIVHSFRYKNPYFVTLKLRRLHELSNFFLKKLPEEYSSQNIEKAGTSFQDDNQKSGKRVLKKRKEYLKGRFIPLQSKPKIKERKSLKLQNSLPAEWQSISSVNESLNTNWTDYMIGSYQVYPLTISAEQRYILNYLTPMGEYQELIGHVIEEKALSLIMRYIDLHQNPDVRLVFEALKCLAGLLCHKKLAVEFLNTGGLHLLLKVPRPSLAATGVSICFYYLAYNIEILEKICQYSIDVISEFMSYVLWLLECSHDSSRCHATLFFTHCFYFKVFLKHFDAQDGLRKLFNVVSTLDIFVGQNDRTLTEDQIFDCRLTTRHVCAALRRYFEGHLAFFVEEKGIETPNSHTRSTKVANLSDENIQKYIEILNELGVTPLLQWKPVKRFINLDGIQFLLDLTSQYFGLNYSGRAETVKNVVEALKICSITVPVQLKLCDRVNNSDYAGATGMSTLLQAAEGEKLPVVEIQRSALMTIINCVCSKVPSSDSSGRSSRKKSFRHTEVLCRTYRAVRTKNGINILINLLFVKTPITDADSIRALACQALCGLARCETVKQIISKLPLVTRGQLLDLMKEPVLQEKYSNHVKFCKSGLQLLERVTGKESLVNVSSESLTYLNKVCISEVVAKTKVVYHENQLMQLILDHLTKKGFNETVMALQREMMEKMPHTKSTTIASFPSSSHNSSTRSAFSTLSSPSTSAITTIPPPSIPLKIVFNKKAQSPVIRSPPPCRVQKLQTCSGVYTKSPLFSKKHQNVLPFKSLHTPSVSLDSIVTEFLRKQHSLCKNPMLTCPPFDLFTRHKCPEPHYKLYAPNNLTLRLQNRETYFQDGGYKGYSLTSKYIFSKFRLFHSCRDEEGHPDLTDFTTCTFFNNGPSSNPLLLVGTSSWYVKVFNVNTGKLAHSSVTLCRNCLHIESKEDTPWVLTCNGGRLGTSNLFSYVDDFIQLHTFYETPFMEFGKRSVDRLIGTKHDAAVIYDTATFSEIQYFSVGDTGNNYLRNRATLDFSDELVLTDGVVFDIRSGGLVHKLDKFNSSSNGVFHPNGREIISNSEIWDIRTFKLLRTVAALDQCTVTFNKPGTVIYAVTNRSLRTTPDKLTNFYTFDATDYNPISTINCKRPVNHVCTDLTDRFLASIENFGSDCSCRIYEIGRRKEQGDDSDDSEDSDDEPPGDRRDVEDHRDDNDGQNVGNEEEEGDEEVEVNWEMTSDSSVTSSSSSSEEGENEEAVEDGGDEDEDMRDDDDDDDDDGTLFSINMPNEDD